MEALKLAQEILATRSLRPLLADATSTAITTLATAFASHLESKGEQQTSVDLQLRVLAGAGVCYLSIAGGGLLKIASGSPRR